MDEELHAAIVEVREWAAREGGSMDHLSDAAVLEAIQHAATNMPFSTVEIVRDHGLKRLAPVLARFFRGASDTTH
jgi:hypothetical protein